MIEFGAEFIGIDARIELLLTNDLFILNVFKLLLIQIHLYGLKLTQLFDVNILLTDTRYVDEFENPNKLKQVDVDEKVKSYNELTNFNLFVVELYVIVKFTILSFNSVINVLIL